MNYVKSPCIRVCMFESWLDKKVVASEEELCVGCLRTKHEIRTWPYQTEEWKQQVNERVEERKMSRGKTV